jgi:hypothetical protein
MQYNDDVILQDLTLLLKILMDTRKNIGKLTTILARGLKKVRQPCCKVIVI